MSLAHYVFRGILFYIERDGSEVHKNHLGICFFPEVTSGQVWDQVSGKVSGKVSDKVIWQGDFFVFTFFVFTFPVFTFFCL